MRTSRNIRPLVVLTACAAVFPLVVLLDLFAFALGVFSECGHWPRFGDPDPKTLTADWQRFRIAFGLTGFPLASVAAMGVALLGRWRDPAFPCWKLVGLTAGSAATVILLMQLDPGGLFNWFWD